MTPDTGRAREAGMPPPPDQTGARQLTATLVVILGGLAATGTLATNIMLPSLPSIATAFGIPTSAMGVTLSVFFATFAVGQLFVGPLSDRFGRQWLIVGGLAVFVAGSLLCALADDLPLLVAGRIVQALGVCAASVLARAIARDLFEGEALARALALTMIAMAAAPGFSPLLGGVLDRLFGWRSAFLAVAAAAIILGVGYAMLLGETHHPHRRVARAPAAILRDYGRLAADRRFFVPAATVALVLGGLFAMFAASPAILIDGLGFSAIELGLFFAATVFVVFAAGLLAPRLAHRTGQAQAAMAGLAIALAGGTLLLAFGAAGVTTLAAYAGPAAIFLFGMGLANPLGTAIALTPFGDRAGLASAALGFLQMAGAALGATLATSLPGTAVVALGSVLASFLGVATILFAIGQNGPRRPAIVTASGDLR